MEILEKYFKINGKLFLPTHRCSFYKNFNKLSGGFFLKTNLEFWLTMETYEDYTGDLPRPDSDICEFNEFVIYDEFDNDITELILEEYKLLLKSKKI